MNVLVFSSLYPNNVWPHHGVFVKERMATFAKVHGSGLKVVAPVPYFPSLGFGSRRLYTQVARQEIRDGLEVYHPRYVMTPKVGMVSYGMLMYLSVLPAIKRIHQAFDFDVIDAHFVYPDGFAAVLLGRYFRRPVVVSARGSDINLYAGFPLVRHLLRYTLRRADKVISVCEALKDAMVDLGIDRSKITVIPNGVDSGKFFPFPKVEARRKLGLPDKRIILSVGGLIPRKGFDILIDALDILVRERGDSNLYLVIAGEGPSHKDLRQLVASRALAGYVHFAGAVPHEELCLWYSAADLFCLASSREGWPNVILESLACGTPVVATAVWGIPDIIRSEDLGLLTERNERDLAQTIKKALAHRWDSDSIVRYARSHTWERVADSVFRVFESVLADRSPRGQDSGVMVAPTSEPRIRNRT